MFKSNIIFLQTIALTINIWAPSVDRRNCKSHQEERTDHQYQEKDI